LDPRLQSHPRSRRWESLKNGVWDIPVDRSKLIETRRKVQSNQE
jgi:hypothetical protein